MLNSLQRNCPRVRQRRAKVLSALLAPEFEHVVRHMMAPDYSTQEPELR